MDRSMSLTTYAGASTGLSIVGADRKSTRLNSSHGYISYAVFCLKKKKNNNTQHASYIYAQPIAATPYAQHAYPSLSTSYAPHQLRSGSVALHATCRNETSAWRCV